MNDESQKIVVPTPNGPATLFTLVTNLNRPEWFWRLHHETGFRAGPFTTVEAAKENLRLWTED